MKISVHRAVFGEKQRKHSLRTSSLPSDIRLDGLAAHTDRPSADPPQGSTLAAYLSGFPYEQWYVLVRTFPDETAARGGMVRSFCVLVEQTDLANLSELTCLIQLLPSLTTLSTEWTTWEEAAKSQAYVHMGKREHPSDFVSPEVRGLATHLFNGIRPAVWTGHQEDFEQALTCIWANMPPSLRCFLRFGHSHAPVDLPSPPPHTVSSPALAAPRWSGQVVLPVQVLDAPIAARLLTGEAVSTPLAAFVDALPDVTDFVKLKRAQTCLTLLDEVERDQAVDALPIARLLKDLAPDPQDVSEGKDSVLKALLKQLSKSDGGEIRRFANFDAQAFADGDLRLRQALEVRLNQLLALPEAPVDELVRRAFDSDIINWWRNGVLQALQAYLQQLDTASATVVWRWWASYPSLISSFTKWLTSSADEILFQSAPQQVTSELAQALLDGLPNTFKWLRVVAWAVLHESDVALTNVLREPFSDTDGVRALRTQIGNEAFFQAALVNSDTRAWREAGVAAKCDPRLLRNLDPRIAAWRTIWREAITLGVPVLEFVPEPEQVTSQTMDVLRSGEVVPEEVLSALSETPQANLLNYPFREQVWAVLPVSSRDSFLAATARAVLLDGNVPQRLEVPLAKAALNPLQLSKLLMDNETARPNVLQAYVSILLKSHGQETEMIAVINNLQTYRLTLPESELKALGVLIRARAYRNTAVKILTAFEKSPTPTLKALTEETLELLSGMRKLAGHLSLRRSNAHREYFRALHSTLSRLFQRGPVYLGLWEDAGGDPRDLPLNTTPNEAWREALKIVESDKVNLLELLNVARRHYVNDDELIELQRLSHQIKK